MALFFMRGQRRETIDGLLPADVYWESPVVVATSVMQSRKPIVPYAKSLGMECTTAQILGGEHYNSQAEWDECRRSLCGVSWIALNLSVNAIPMDLSRAI